MIFTNATPKNHPFSMIISNQQVAHQNHSIIRAYQSQTPPFHRRGGNETDAVIVLLSAIGGVFCGRYRPGQRSNSSTTCRLLIRLCCGKRWDLVHCRFITGNHFIVACDLVNILQACMRQMRFGDETGRQAVPYQDHNKCHVYHWSRQGEVCSVVISYHTHTPGSSCYYKSCLYCALIVQI